MKTLLTQGNSKLPRTTAIFNLPALETCPGSTPICRKLCYAKQAEAMYPRCLPSREAKLEASHKDNFVSEISRELVSLSLATKQKKHVVDTVRLHESGDFYSQEYVDKWIEIVGTFPSISFYAYTRSYMLDFSKAPSNFRVIGSIDSDSSYKMWTTFDHYSFMGKETNALNKSVTCPGSCFKCNYCFNSKVSQVRVVFPIHGVSRKGKRVKR